MIQKAKALIVKYWEVLIYLVFGVLTTVVNYVIYLPVYNILGLSAALSNAIAWVGAVAFAYLTNKPFVFKSHDRSRDGYFVADCRYAPLEWKSLEAAYIRVGCDFELHCQQAAGLPQKIRATLLFVKTGGLFLGKL